MSNTVGPVSLVMDLRIAHECLGSSSNPSLNDHLQYPGDIDRTLNEVADDKNLQYRADYNNRHSHSTSFMSAIASTSGCLHSEFVCLLFLQPHKETDRFLPASGVQLKQTSTFTTRCSPHNGSPMDSRSHTHPSHTQNSRLLTSSLS